jgi:GR25 family glycosyltransferase involved in LPS biosynthesis
MIDAYIITIKDVQTGRDTIESIEQTGCKLKPFVFEATTPDTIEEDLLKFKYFNRKDFKWTWPIKDSQNHLDMKTGVYKFAYDAINQDKKVACSISHMRLWDLCVVKNEPIIIFEPDAIVIRTIDVEELKGYRVVGLNDPRGATRRSGLFHEKMRDGIQPVPTVNNSGEFHPQGLAGHSAYYIEPDAAKELLDKVKEYGMWPNDAYMCKELFPWIRVVYPYYTKVRPSVSTTTR